MLPENYVPIVDFLEGIYRPMDRKPITVHEPWRSILTAAFTPDPVTGKLLYSTVILSCVKKSGKSLYAGGVTAWFAECISPPGDEILLVANKREQVLARVFRDLTLARENHPLLKKAWKVQTKRIETSNGTSIIGITTEAGGEAGANPGLIVHDELWAWTAGPDERLFAELSPVPNKLNSIRLIVTYAGYSSTSTVLWREYEAAMACPPHPDFAHLTDDEGKPVVRASRETRTFCYWDHVPRMPWQTDADGQAYYQDQERKCLPSEFLRLHRNRWTSGEEGIDMDWWDACVDPDYEPPESMPTVYLALGADASFKKDLTAVMTVYKKGGRFYLGPYKWWQPDPKKEEFDVEATAGDYIRGLKGRYRVRCGNYDSYQFASCALGLKRQGFRIEEFKQSQDNAKRMGNKIVEVLRHRKIVLPPDKFLRQQAASVTLKVSADGVQLTKAGARNKKIDSITALSMALLAAEKLPDSDKPVGASVMVLG